MTDLVVFLLSFFLPKQHNNKRYYITYSLLRSCWNAHADVKLPRMGDLNTLAPEFVGFDPAQLFFLDYGISVLRPNCLIIFAISLAIFFVLFFCRIEEIFVFHDF